MLWINAITYGTCQHLEMLTLGYVTSPSVVFTKASSLNWETLLENSTLISADTLATEQPCLFNSAWRSLLGLRRLGGTTKGSLQQICAHWRKMQQFTFVHFNQFYCEFLSVHKERVLSRNWHWKLQCWEDLDLSRNNALTPRLPQECCRFPKHNCKSLCFFLGRWKASISPSSHSVPSR